MADDLAKIPFTVRLGQAALRVIKQNIKNSPWNFTTGLSRRVVEVAGSIGGSAPGIM